MRPGPKSFALFTMLISAIAVAQAPPPPPPPYYAPYPPPQPYPYPPPQPYPYPPPQPQPYAPTQYQPPAVLPYREGAPTPVGYHLEERPRKGLITTGWIISAIPYGIGVTAALSANFKNYSGWLAVPLVGPWLTLGRRNYGCERDNDTTDNGKDGLDCVADIFVVMGLIMSGTMQATGATLIFIGYTSTKTVLARDAATLRIHPMRVGSGRGLGFSGSF